MVPVDPPLPVGGTIVPGNQPWIYSGTDVAAGEAITIEASGRITFCMPSKWSRRDPPQVGPAGTYHWDDSVGSCPFPLPAAAGGPAPCYCLIGRIGDGPPFYVGAAKSWTADRSGPLWLGTNDFDVSDNTGAFHVNVTRPIAPQPVRFQEFVSAGEACGGPLPGCSVVVFYVDGLRPDVVREMAAMGHIPNINRVFVEGGAWPRHTFTAFPSDTITSNGTMWTGCFSDRHGLKGQVRFSRRTLHSESYLEPLGPNRSARLLAPRGFNKVAHEAQVSSVGMLHGEEAAAEWDQTRVSGVPPLYMHLRNHGGDWQTGALPIMTELPPVLWSRSLVRAMPYFHAHKAWNYIDDANTHYAQKQLLPNDVPVTVIWLPETDSVSHKFSRGQFGVTRRTIARADEMIGCVVEQLAAEGRLCRTYLMLVSDHGHHGGEDTYLSHFDIANEFFYKPREISPDGRWIGGGLGISARQHRFWNRHPEDKSTHFVFIDGDSDGAARIFLPRRCFHSGDWMGPARPGEMLAYQLADHLPPVNLVESLTAVQAARGDGCVDHPVDLVLLKLSECSILISTLDRGQAVIDRVPDGCGRWSYRYTPIENVRPTGDGQVAYQECSPLALRVDNSTRGASRPPSDPLRLLEQLPGIDLSRYYDERTWLELTQDTIYPDAVVALTRHMLWQENLQFREREFAPDLVVTARPGWYFGVEATKGTTHGYPLADAMRATLFVSGPNIRRGACIQRPYRLADLTPTLLEMTGTPYEPADFDGQAIREIYLPCCLNAADGERCVVQCEHLAEGERGRGEVGPRLPLPLPPAPAPHEGGRVPDALSLPLPLPLPPSPPPGIQPVFWDELDLRAWHPLGYTPAPRYEHLPISINRPNSALDLNNIAYNALTISDLSVLRLMDDVLFPLSGDEQAITRVVERIDWSMRHSNRDWLAGLAYALDIGNVTVSDSELSSTGNMKRVDRSVDWLQARMQNADRRLAGLFGQSHTPGTRLLHGTVDWTQSAFWDGYRFGQRLLMCALDEKLLNSIENTTDRAINSFRQQPAEVLVSPGRAIAPSALLEGVSEGGEDGLPPAGVE